MLLEELPIHQSPEATSTPRLFFRVASLLYVGVLLTGGYYNIINNSTFAVAPGRIIVFIGSLLALFTLEHFARRIPVTRMGKSITIALLVTRMMVFEVVAVVDNSGISNALYLIVPFMAYFSLGKWISYALALFYMALFLAKLFLFVPLWYIHKEPISDVLMLSIGLVFAISMASVANIADANRRRAEGFLSDLMDSHQQLKLYAARSAELATAEERNRLARDIHDGLGHYLTTIIIQLEKAIAFRQLQPQEAEIALLDARRQTREALQDVRRSVGALRLTGRIFSFSAALTALVNTVSNERLTVKLDIVGDETLFPKSTLISLYRATQESLTNIQRHASARRVHLRVHFCEQGASVSVEDDGQGFDSSLLEQLPPDRHHRFGLQGIHERLEVVGGTLKVKSSPGQGTQVDMYIPKSSSMSAQESWSNE